MWYIPDALFDGYDRRFVSQYVPALEAHLSDPSPLAMEAVFRQESDSAGTLFVHVDVADTIRTTDNVVHFVICEDGVGRCPNLARSMLPDAELTITAPGESADFVRPYVLDNSWDPKHVTFVAIAQSHAEDRRVLQAAQAVRGQGIAVAPAGGLAASGDPGGPHAPSSAAYTLGNIGIRAVEYSVSHREPWLSVYGESGTIPVGGTVEIVVELNELVRFLDEGYYCDVVSFDNMTDDIGSDTRVVSVRVGDPGASEAYSFDFEEDPGWSSRVLWWRGAPLGSGGENGYPDPTSAHSGENIFGYNLNGDYENGIPERHLTTSPLDCSEFFGTKLRFWRWLGVDDSVHDHASIHVSSDSLYWTPVWRNSEAVTDSTWTLVEYDISGVADGESTVYVRWTMGPTDHVERYCGWHIDDVEIWAAREAADVSFNFSSLSNYPNPGRPATTFLYELSEPAHARLAVYDLSGRLVRVVENGPAEPGWRVVAWDGTNELGVPVASGVYFCRLEVGQLVEARKIVLLR